MKNLRDIAKVHEEKLKKIKVALFDVDGIMTDARVFWAGAEVGFNRYFNVHDGYGLKILMEAGIKVGIITGGDSVGVKNRFEGLKVNFLYMGNEDKRKAFDEIIKKCQVDASEVLYMGDEFFDLPLLKRSGFSATVPNASYEVLEEVDYVTSRLGGEGAVREVIDILRFAKGIVPHIEY